MAGEAAEITTSYLAQGALFLAAAAIAAPFAKSLKIGPVLGYLAAGALIGPYGLGYAVYAPGDILHIAELGVVLLLFLIGLELHPQRLWLMRTSIVNYGGAQMLLSTALIAAALVIAGFKPPRALFIGLLMSLSSTAFAIQILREKGEVMARHGRLAFGILLMQDMMVVPLLALVPLFAPYGSDVGEQMTVLGAVRSLAIIGAVVLGGRLVVNRLLKLVASVGLKEAMTASALLIVVGAAFLMQLAGLSPALGAFVAGVLLADSEYRHEVEANIEPFGALLLGLFFTAIGMSLDFRVMLEDPLRIAIAVAVLVVLKGLVLYGLGRVHGLPNDGARRLAIICSQAGEFAFVLLTAANRTYTLPGYLANEIAVIVTLSMVATPILLIADDWYLARRKGAAPKFDQIDADEGHIIVAGMGTFGQIVARILRARGIPFTALDSSAERVAMLKQFGAAAFFGDVSRPEILRALQIDKARAFVLAIDDVESSLEVAEYIRRQHPNVVIYARARDRDHAHRLLDLGITRIRRETYLSALDIAHQVLRGLGLKEVEARKLIETFREHDERLLRETHAHFRDADAMRARAAEASEELADLFRRDAEASDLPHPAATPQRKDGNEDSR
ncbi:MAG: monovalent cation:proton antiporter-2 (CPA2) family protein [Hyphomicrobiaceae bacterium]